MFLNRYAIVSLTYLKMAHLSSNYAYDYMFFTPDVEKSSSLMKYNPAVRLSINKINKIDSMKKGCFQRFQLLPVGTVTASNPI